VNRVKEELLQNNPYVDETGQHYNGIDLNYHYGKEYVGEHFHKNILEVMCRKVGVRNPAHTVDIFLTDEERNFATEKMNSLNRPRVTIHIMPGGFDNGRKLWPLKYWRNLAAMLRKRKYTLIQLGNANEQYIEGTINMLGTQDIRRSIALMEKAELHIGVVSSLMHAAAAVKTPAIIIFGGFERFSIHGYDNIVPLESSIPCSPCIRANTNIGKCPLNTQCMREITPRMVCKKAEWILKKQT